MWSMHYISGMVLYVCHGVVVETEYLGEHTHLFFVFNLCWTTVMDIGGISGILLCTTGVIINLCAGLLFGGLEYSCLCTTVTSLNFCAGFLSWFVNHIQDYGLYKQVWIDDCLYIMLPFSLNNGIINLCTLFPSPFPHGFYLARFFNETGFMGDWLL